MNMINKVKTTIRGHLDRHLEHYLLEFLERYLPDHLDAIQCKFLIHNHLIFGGPNRLHLTETAVINYAIFKVTSGEITLEDQVFFGHNVCLLTGSHDYTRTGVDRQIAVPQTGYDFFVGEGAWIASNATVIGPCKIGKNGVVAASSPVNSDIPGNAIAAGIPVKIIGVNDGRQENM